MKLNEAASDKKKPLMEFVVPLVFVISFIFPSVSIEYLEVLTENVNLHCYKRKKESAQLFFLNSQLHIQKYFQ